MKERKQYIAVYKSAMAAGADQVGLRVDDDFQLESVLVDGAIAGGPSAASIDIKDDGVEIPGFIALSNLTNGKRGPAAPVAIAAGSVITIDQNFTAGTTPTFTGMLQFVGYIGE